MLNRFCLTAAILAATAAPAAAACTPTVEGNLNVFDCSSNNQPSDGDELKDFITKAGVPVSSIDSSLNKNTSAPGDQNIKIATPDAGATFSQQGNGFAELKSSAAGLQTNTLRDLVYTPIIPSTVDGNPPVPFPGFDGAFFRGQVDAIGSGQHPAWDGVVTMTIDFSGGGSQVVTFNAGKGSQDIGVIGFDGNNSPETLVASVKLALDSTGAWNESKQFTFSVPGVAPIPEPRTWVMLLIGFGLLGAAAWRKSERRLTPLV